MKKFRTVLKEKQKKHDLVQEKRILLGFKKVYGALLEKYETASFHELDSETQPVFLAELNSYWSEDKGLLIRGKRFLRGESDLLNESSSEDQKKLYMKKRMIPVMAENFRQGKLKNKLYDIINEVYVNVKAKDINGVMDPEKITDTILESFQRSLQDFMKEVHFELTESGKNEEAS